MIGSMVAVERVFALKRRDPSGRRQGSCETGRSPWTGRRSPSPTSSRRAGGSARTCGRHRSIPTPGLDELLGAEVWVKHENHQPVGAFKVRGGVNLVSQLGEEERAARADRGVDRQPRAVDRVRRAAPRGRRPHLRPREREPGQAGRDAGARRRADRAWEGLRRRPRALRTAGCRARLPLRPLRQRAASDRGCRHRDARDRRGATRRRRDHRPHRRRQRSGRRVHRREGDPAGDRGDRGAVGRCARGLPLLAGSRAPRRRERRRSPRASRRGRRSSYRSRSSGSTWTTSCSSPRTRSGLRTG